jgi:hypothetical protein
MFKKKKFLVTGGDGRKPAHAKIRPDLKNKPGMVVNAFDPSYLGGRSRRIIVQG